MLVPRPPKSPVPVPVTPGTVSSTITRRKRGEGTTTGTSPGWRQPGDIVPTSPPFTAPPGPSRRLPGGVGGAGAGRGFVGNGHELFRAHDNYRSPLVLLAQAGRSRICATGRAWDSIWDPEAIAAPHLPIAAAPYTSQPCIPHCLVPHPKPPHAVPQASHSVTHTSWYRTHISPNPQTQTCIPLPCTLHWGCPNPVPPSSEKPQAEVGPGPGHVLGHSQDCTVHPGDPTCLCPQPPTAAIPPMAPLPAQGPGQELPHAATPQ